MNTPGHAVLSVASVVGANRPELAVPVLVGAVLPDVPIALLYLDARFRRGITGERIWTEAYQEPFWQAVIHGAHSLPFALLGAALAWALALPAGVAFFASVLGHALLDFPIHVQDAHRHFFPLSDYRFISPLSYWDVRHHARVVLAIEALLVVAAGVLLWPTCGAVTHALLIGVGVFYAESYRRLLRPQPLASAGG